MPDDTILVDAPEPRALLVLAHGAGAGMRHPFLERVAQALTGHGISTFRYQFPYMAAGGRRPDPPAALQHRVRTAVEEAGAARPELPLFAGGKSLGGRMTSMAAANGGLAGVRGIVFLGFPLHPPKKPGTARAEHLDAVSLPMLFLQGTRDDLADLALLRPICDRLRPRATLAVVDAADHSFAVLKRSGRTSADVLAELTRTIADWTRAVDAGATLSLNTA